MVHDVQLTRYKYLCVHLTELKMQKVRKYHIPLQHTVASSGNLVYAPAAD